MDEELTELLARLMQAGTVTNSDVMILRDAVWTDETITEPVVDALFALNDALASHSPVWTDFFIEAIEYYLVDQCVPQGFVDDSCANWLQSRIDKNGRVTTLTEIELLVAIIERAESAPEALQQYAIAQIENVIVSGEGPTRTDGVIRPNCVDAVEVELLRRLIFAGGGEGAVIVGSEEADMLFRIKDATLQGDNAPTWLRLFVQGVGNHLMAHSDYRPLSREEMVEFDTHLDEYVPSLGRFFRRMLPSDKIGYGTISEAFKTLFPKTEDRFAKRLALDNSHLITIDEASWLKAHIASDGETDAYEKALLTFIIDEAEHAPSMLDRLRLQA
ncbi:MAG: hypothetical protein AABY88_03450 [Pseudomonadota bacterium]